MTPSGAAAAEASGANRSVQRPSGSRTTLSGGAVGWAPGGAPTVWNRALASGRSTTPSTGTVAVDPPERVIVTVSPGATPRLAAVCWASSTPASAPTRVRSSRGKVARYPSGRPSDRRRAGRPGDAPGAGGEPVDPFEADRQRVRGDRVGADEVEHRGRVRSGLDLDLPVHSDVPDGPGGHGGCGRRRGRRRGSPAGPPRRRPRTPSPRAGRLADAGAPPAQSSAATPSGRHRPAAGRSTPVGHLPAGVEPRGDGLVVCRDDQGRTELVHRCHQHLHDVVRVLPVELAGGLVGEDEDRTAGEHPRTATRWAWPPDSASGRAPARPPSSSRSSAAAARSTAAGSSTPARSSGSATFSMTSSAGTRLGPWNTTPTERPDPFDARPARRPVQAGEQVQQRRLARARRPDQRDPHARRHGAVDVPDRAHLRPPRRNVRLTPVQRTRTCGDPGPARRRSSAPRTAGSRPHPPVAQGDHPVGGRGQGRAVTAHDDRHVATGGLRATARGSRPPSWSPARRSARRRAPPPGRPPARPRARRARTRRRRARPGRPGARPQPDRAEHLVDRPPWAPRRQAPHELDVGRDGQVVEQVPRRGDGRRCARRASGPASASGRWLIRRPRIQTVPPSGSSRPGQAAQQGRLARPGGPDQRHELARGHVERHTAQGEGLVVARAVEAVDRACRDGGCGERGVASCAPPQRVGDDPPRVDVVRTRRARQGQHGLPAALPERVALDGRRAPPCRSRG